ncbi:MAG TPA: PIN domain-containing protein [Candidatus Thermoplasmatota archaeon]|nr:PIN domain-containing protein [Candidatus Thermoplasmatota archaeon]
MIADTSFLIDLARGDPGARAALAEIEATSEALRVPAPAIAKLWEALGRSRRPPRDEAALRALLAGVPAAPFAIEHAFVAGRLLADAAAAGLALDPFDAMVAAIAIADEEQLVTRNVREFEAVRELTVRTY